MGWRRVRPGRVGVPNRSGGRRAAGPSVLGRDARDGVVSIKAPDRPADDAR